MSNYCFTDVVEGNRYRVAKIVENESGYSPLGKANPDDPHEMDKFVFKSLDQVRSVVNNMKENLGVNKHREVEIKLSTMF